MPEGPQVNSARERHLRPAPARASAFNSTRMSACRPRSLTEIGSSMRATVGATSKVGVIFYRWSLEMGHILSGSQ